MHDLEIKREALRLVAAGVQRLRDRAAPRRGPYDGAGLAAAAVCAEAVPIRSVSAVLAAVHADLLHAGGLRRAPRPRSFPVNPVRRVHFHDGAEVVLDLYNQHLVCLLPQHGVGKKHTRPIVLEAWQEALISQAPWAFLRGCIRSDGCVFVNRTGPYEYLSHGFANLSTDNLDLFEATCVALGLRPRRYATAIRLNRRGDAARLLQHVGTKR